MIKRWNTFKFFSYALGSLCWLMLLGLLMSTCVVNVPLYIDGLWVKPIGEGLVKNLIGEIAFHVEGYGCEDQFIFVAPYHPEGVGEESQLKSLTSLIDTQSWKKMESDTISTTYTDLSHRYVLFQTSDGVNMKVYKK